MHTNKSLVLLQSINNIESLEPRLNLLLRIAQRPRAPLRPTPHPINLRFREPSRLSRRIISHARQLLDPLIIDPLTPSPVRSPVNGHDRRTPQAQIMLQSHLGPVDESVIRPSPKLPHQLRALRYTRRA